MVVEESLFPLSILKDFPSLSANAKVFCLDSEFRARIMISVLLQDKSLCGERAVL